MGEKKENWVVNVISEICAFFGAFFIMMIIIGLISGNLKINPEKKIVSKKFHAITFNGPDSPLDVTYKVLEEQEIKETIEDKQKFFDELNDIIENDGETIRSAILDWNKDFEAGETIAINDRVYIYGDTILHINIDKKPALKVKLSVNVDKEYVANVHNELWDLEKDIKITNSKFYLTRIDVPASNEGIYVDVRIGTPDKVRDLTYSWIAKGWAKPIVTNHPGHNAALEYAKEHKMGMWGGNTDENMLDVHEGQDSTFIEIKE